MPTCAPHDEHSFNPDWPGISGESKPELPSLKPNFMLSNFRSAINNMRWLIRYLNT